MSNHPSIESSDYQYPDRLRQDILAMIPDDGSVIGSIGCGYAPTEGELVKRGRKVHGVDTSPEAIEVASRRLTSARVITPDDSMPFEENSLDGLILADVLEHIPGAWNALASFAKSVRPGGWVVISVPNMRNFPVLRRFFFGGEWPEESAGIFDRTHVQVMSHARLARWCRQADLEPEEWFSRYQPERPRRGPMLDRLSFGMLHTWFMYQIQVRCRRRIIKPDGGVAR